MPKGVRMSSARRMPSGEVLPISALAKGMALACDGCGVEVIYNSGHVRNAESLHARVEVAPYLRLSKHGNHRDGCPHSIYSQVQAVVGRGTPIDDSPEPFVDLGEHRFALRLNIPREEFRSLGTPGQPLTPEQVRERVERSWSGARLAPYCRSAAGLARIAALIDDGAAELRDLIKIRYEDEEIGWTDFFYGPDRYGTLVNRLVRAQKGSRINPVALLVRVRQHVAATEKTTFHVRCAFEVTQEKPRILAAVRLRGSERHLRRMRLDTDYIVFGEWRLEGQKTAKEKWRDGTEHDVRFDNLSVNIWQVAQFCELMGQQDEE